jgi:hypothetical protein
MLEPIKDVPTGVMGLRATGTVTKDDYDTVFKPPLQAAHAEGRRVRLLYQFMPEFTGFTAGAGLEDVRLGLKYLRLFERCAIVSDLNWIREWSRMLGTMMPCPVKVFGHAEWDDALRWITAAPEGTVSHRLIADAGVLVVEPTGRLRAEDFDALAMTVDPWIEANGTLRGIVVHTRGFPGWENLGSFLRHMRFLGDHHRKVGRVALAANGTVAEVAPSLTDPFIEAELKHFDFERLDDAIAWASAGAPRAHQSA